MSACARRRAWGICWRSASPACSAWSANAAIAAGEADLVAFGVPFLANPDLPERWRRGAPLNAPQLEHFYSGEEKGYIDYPTLEAVTA